MKPQITLRSLLLVVTAVCVACAVVKMAGILVLLYATAAACLAVWISLRSCHRILSGFATIAISSAIASAAALPFELIEAAVAGGIVGGFIWMCAVRRFASRSADQEEEVLEYRRHWRRIGRVLTLFGISTVGVIYIWPFFEQHELNALGLLLGIVFLLLGVPHLIESTFITSKRSRES